MQTNRHISENALTFSRWTRKNYAVFVSLKKVIKIARLSVDICLAASHKNLSLIRILAYVLYTCKTDEAFENDEFSVQELLLELTSVQVLVTQQGVDQKKKYFWTYNTSPLSASC